MLSKECPEVYSAIFDVLEANYLLKDKNVSKS